MADSTAASTSDAEPRAASMKGRPSMGEGLEKYLLEDGSTNSAEVLAQRAKRGR